MSLKPLDFKTFTDNELRFLHEHSQRNLATLHQQMAELEAEAKRILQYASLASREMLRRAKEVNSHGIL